MEQEAVEDRDGGGYVADELISFFDRPVRGHYGQADLVAVHNDVQKILRFRIDSPAKLISPGQTLFAHLIRGEWPQLTE